MNTLTDFDLNRLESFGIGGFVTIQEQNALINQARNALEITRKLATAQERIKMLEAENRALQFDLKLAVQYLKKAAADNLMQGCVLPPQAALARLENRRIERNK
jgi:hypothetical protein